MSRGDSSAVSTLLSVLAVLGALALFCLLFTVFLLIPFIVFLIAIGALMISEWNRKAQSQPAAPPSEAPTPAVER